MGDDFDVDDASCFEDSDENFQLECVVIVKLEDAVDGIPLFDQNDAI